MARREGPEAAQVAPLNLGRLGLGRSPGPVRAGGGVVWKRGDDGHPVVILVHRPKYDDWSLPKGKLQPGEEEADAAVREVEEETGLRCRLGPELPSSSYQDRFGRDKTVRYWAMTPIDDTSTFVPNAEVDEVRWLPPDTAAELLSYERDREILRSLPAEVPNEFPSECDE